jgi:exodeoxyribonuclease VII small subunit
MNDRLSSRETSTETKIHGRVVDYLHRLASIVTLRSNRRVDWMKTQDDDPSEDMSFEDAISAIEVSVRRLEGNSLGLDQSLEEYAKATRYIALCQQQLTSAKRKIEQLKGMTREGAAITEVWEEPDNEQQKPKKRKPT